MHRASILGCIFLLVVACKGDEGAKSSKSSASAGADKVAAADSPASGGKALFDKEKAKDPCALLTAEMVATVAKTTADKVTQRNLSTMCLYEWEGGNAGIAFVKVFDSVADAQEKFERSHKSMTGAEVKAAMNKIGGGAKEKLADEREKGKKAPSDKAVDVTTDALAENMGGGITFEDVSGVGDRASYETTRHETKMANMAIVSYANKLDVLVGNLGFDIMFTLNSTGHQGEMHKEEAVALAKQVVAGL